MSSYSLLTTIYLICGPFLAAVVFLVVCCVLALRGDAGADGPARLMTIALKCLPIKSRDWGQAMAAELAQVSGTFERWQFSAGCFWALLLSRMSAWSDRRNAGPCIPALPLCGVLTWIVPPAALVSLWLSGIVFSATSASDDLFRGGFVSWLVSSWILASALGLFSGIPLAVLALVRRETARWLYISGAFWSVTIFGYLQLIQYIGAQYR
jgi:hypothetical protein